MDLEWIPHPAVVVFGSLIVQMALLVGLAWTYRAEARERARMRQTRYDWGAP